jgi:hypothetical protein
MKIPSPVLDVLRHSTVTDTVLLLPPQQLDRKLYEQVNKALAAMGGKWSRSAKGHTFEFDPGDVLAEVVATGEVLDWKKQAQFFETPAEVAGSLVLQADLAGAKDLRILEPSAGRGAIAARIVSAMDPSCTLHLLEKEDRNREALHQWAAKQRGVDIAFVNPPGHDFLQLAGNTPYDRIIANPPFSRRQDARHVLHMWECLAPGGVLASAMSPGVEFRQEREYHAVRGLIDGYGTWERLPAGSFKASGTEVSTGIVRLAKPITHDALGAERDCGVQG